VQAIAQERAEEVHFSRGAWVDALRAGDGARPAGGVPSAPPSLRGPVPRGSLAALLRRAMRLSSSSD
jgi:hypothetical protein